MVGEPVHATVAASNFNPKHTLTYTWNSTGGKIEGKDTGATVDTNGIGSAAATPSPLPLPMRSPRRTTKRAALRPSP